MSGLIHLRLAYARWLWKVDFQRPFMPANLPMRLAFSEKGSADSSVLFHIQQFLDSFACCVMGVWFSAWTGVVGN